MKKYFIDVAVNGVIYCACRGDNRRKMIRTFKAMVRCYRKIDQHARIYLTEVSEDGFYHTIMKETSREYQPGERFYDKKTSRLITIIRCVSYNDVYTATVVPTDPDYVGPYSYTEMFHGFELVAMEYLGK